MSRGTIARRAARVTAAVALGAVAWELQRRADRRAVAADPATAELAHQITGRPVAVASKDGTRLHAEVFGPDGAPAIVLVHGWTNAIAVWHYQIRDLAGRFRVVAYDQRGHGRSGPPQAAAYTPEALGDDLHAVIEATVPEGEQCVVVGHSMGGMTIVSWAGMHADQVRRHVAAAALIGTGMGDLLEQILVLRPRWAARVHRALTPRAVAYPLRLPRNPTPLSYRAVRYVALSVNASPGAVDFTGKLFADCPAPVRAGFGRSFSALDLYTSVPRLDVPTLVMVGELDRLTPPWHARKLADELPQVEELVELRGVGHMLQLEAPDEVTSRVDRLARVHLRARQSATA
ncbi:MAG TPA: alpha/beta hydrolase [Candidatus Dormibacteraeota bacterium]|jgi:pimeloyl-ACP methyl ester carboxylesterase|nr:alpha/beta hydrolase [Candidatus Dormibacteraeota bacterium]